MNEMRKQVGDAYTVAGGPLWRAPRKRCGSSWNSGSGSPKK